MDELGIVGAVPAAVLPPRDPTARLVGRALTVRNVAATAPVPDKVKAGVSGLGEIEAHNLAEPGDVLVVQGVDLCSNLGGMSATIGHRQGEIGAIVDGGVRDVDHSRGIGYPIWSKSVSPITGKWRVETVAINKPVTICGVTVNPGDLVLADETGVCFIPRERAAEVLARAQRNVAAEKLREEKIASGVPVPNCSARRNSAAYSPVMPSFLIVSGHAANPSASRAANASWPSVPCMPVRQSAA